MQSRLQTAAALEHASARPAGGKHAAYAVNAQLNACATSGPRTDAAILFSKHHEKSVPLAETTPDMFTVAACKERPIAALHNQFHPFPVRIRAICHDLTRVDDPHVALASISGARAIFSDLTPAGKPPQNYLARGRIQHLRHR